MGRRNVDERNTRKIAKGSTSYYLTIPIEAMRVLQWKKGQKVVVDVDTRRNLLIIRDWPVRLGKK